MCRVHDESVMPACQRRVGYGADRGAGATTQALLARKGGEEMQLSAATTRWLALASIPGGLLLVLAWAIPEISLLPNIFAPDVRTVPGPTADLALLSTWFTLGFAVLFASVVVLAIASAA